MYDRRPKELILNGMLGNILVPLDGSLFAEHALPVARSIAVRSGATVILTHVHVPHGDRATGEGSLGWRADDAAADDEQRRLEMDELTARCCELVAGDIRVDCNLLDGPIVATLLEHAQLQAADLVVMTTHGRGAFSRAWLGSVVDSFVRHSPVPTLLVRPRHAAETAHPNVEQAWQLARVLIPLDGSALAEQILEPATALACTMGAEVLLLRIVEPPTNGGPPAADTVAYGEATALQASNDAQAYLDGIAEKQREHGLTVRVKIEVMQHTAQTILDVALRDRCDLIAIATHGRGGLARIVIGSVADKIVRGAELPVLLLRP